MKLSKLGFMSSPMPMNPSRIQYYPRGTIVTKQEPEPTEEYQSVWNRLGRRFTEIKQSLLERTRPHKNLHYWVKKVFEEFLAVRVIRFFVQLIAFLLLFYAGITFVLGFDPLLASPLAGLGHLIPILGYIPVPFDMPHGIAQGTATGFFDIIMLIGQAGAFPFIALGVWLIVPALIGRSFCGWICPFGFVQDLCSLTPIRTRYPSLRTNRRLSYFKYIILFITLFFVVWVGLWTFLGIQQDLVAALNYSGAGIATAFWAVFSPSGTLFVIIPQLWMKDVISPIITLWNPPPLLWSPIIWMRLVFLGFIIFIALFIRRPYCRWFCPVGALLGLSGQFSLLTVARSGTECPGGSCENQRCKTACPVGIQVMEKPYGPIHSPNCILCLDCVAKCSHDAVKTDFG